MAGLRGGLSNLSCSTKASNSRSAEMAAFKALAHGDFKEQQAIARQSCSTTSATIVHPNYNTSSGHDTGSSLVVSIP